MAQMALQRGKGATTILPRPGGRENRPIAAFSLVETLTPRTGSTGGTGQIAGYSLVEQRLYEGNRANRGLLPWRAKALQGERGRSRVSPL